MKSYESAVAIFEKLIKANPTNLDELLSYQSDLAGTYMNIGSLQSNTGKPAEALEVLRSGPGDSEKVGPRIPRGHRVAEQSGGHPHQHGHSAGEYRQVG